MRLSDLLVMPAEAGIQPLFSSRRAVPGRPRPVWTPAFAGELPPLPAREGRGWVRAKGARCPLRELLGRQSPSAASSRLGADPPLAPPFAGRGIRPRVGT